jgi:hypothetical protein
MANPEGQTSITGTARLVPATFYIAITPLSGRTAERRIDAEMLVIRLQSQVVTSYRMTQYDHDARVHH